MARPQPAEPLHAPPLPLPDDPATRDERYEKLAEMLDAWMADEHAGEPDWDVDEVPRLRLPVGTG